MNLAGGWIEPGEMTRMAGALIVGRYRSLVTTRWRSCVGEVNGPSCVQLAATGMYVALPAAMKKFLLTMSLMLAVSCAAEDDPTTTAVGEGGKMLIVVVYDDSGRWMGPDDEMNVEWDGKQMFRLSSQGRDVFGAFMVHQQEVVVRVTADNYQSHVAILDADEIPAGKASLFMHVYLEREESAACSHGCLDGIMCGPSLSCSTVE